MSLEFYEEYWETTDSSPEQERERLKNQGHGDAIGAQTKMIQDCRFGSLKELYEQAGIDDWVSRVDHTLSYHEQKSQIKERFDVEGFEVDKKLEEKRLEALKEDWEEQAPDDASMPQEEYRRQKALNRDEDAESGEVTEEDISQINGGDSEDKETDGEPSVSSATPAEADNESSPETSDNGTITLTDARDRCLEAIENAYREDEPILIDALPGLGKSRGAIKAAANTDSQITILTTRGRKGLYSQIEKWCKQFGLTHKTLPSAYEECPTLAGQHGDQEQERLERHYELGVTASDLHRHLSNLPCQNNGSCPYESAWNFNPDNFDVLIGHYQHAQVNKAIKDRLVVIDEFPEQAFLTEIEGQQNAISQFLQYHNDFPFDNYIQLIRGSSGEGYDTALEWFEDRGIDLRDTTAVFDQSTNEYHAHSPLAVLAILEGEDLGNGWEHADLGGGQVAAHNQADGDITLLRPPDISAADGVVGLDGTPTTRLWNLVFYLQFRREQVLTNDERETYIRSLQQLRIIQTEADSILPYSSGRYVSPERDAALIEEVALHHWTQPAVITSQEALDDLKTLNIPIANNSTYYGNIRGSNKLADADVGIILGSPHAGDSYIEKWAALFGIEVERSGKGIDLEYGAFGNEILQHMRENEVLQAIFRFARTGSQTTVYVNTAAIPGWVPRELAFGVIHPRKDSEQSVIEALSDMGTATGPQIANRTGYSENTVRRNLRQLQKEGAVRKTGKKRSTQWHDDGLATINRYGLVDLTSITKNPYKIPIRELGEKLEHQMEQYALDQRERERLLEQMEMGEWRSP